MMVTSSHNTQEVHSASYTKVKVLYDACLLDGSGFLSKIDLSLLQLEDFSAPSPAIPSRIEYTGI